MLATFVIGLREGLEGALIVGIVAAFLARQGRRDAVRQMWIGVAAAVAICAAGGITLQLVAASLPQRQQEALETVIGLIAAAVVSSMVVWMRRHARGLKRELEASAASALKRGSTSALIAMAFLAVLREGFETAVFLVAAFQASIAPVSAGVGAGLGVALAVAVGYAIYRGGVRINLARFFRVTGVVLVLVAAGLVMTAMRTAHEAGWLNVGQAVAVDWSWLVQPGTVRASLLTGFLGLQPRPTVVEFLAWLAFLIPALLFVLWPQGKRQVGASRAPAPVTPAS